MSNGRNQLIALLATSASAVSLMAMLGMVGATPAVADAPTTVAQHVVRSLPTGECSGHPIVGDFDFVRTLTTFSTDGVADRQVIHAQLSGDIRDTVTGVSLPVFGVRVIRLTATGQFVRSTGTNAHVVVPGSGTVLIGAGNSGIDDQGDFYSHGHSTENPTPELCAALAA